MIGAILGKIGGGLATGAGFAGASVVTSGIKNIIPQLEDEVTVEVRGQPGAIKKQLYYLALSTAFGLARRFDLGISRFFPTPPAGLIMVEYDANDDWVRATIRYNTNLLSAAVTTGTGVGPWTVGGVGALVGSIFGPIGSIVGGTLGGLVGGAIETMVGDYTTDGKTLPNDFYAQAVVYSGPKDHVIGGEFNFTGLLAPGIPTTSHSAGAPKLPFAGQPILTHLPSSNPVPPGDNRSRGTDPLFKPHSPSSSTPEGLDTPGNDGLIRRLIPMVFASLSDPGSYRHETFIGPVGGPGGR